MEMADGTYKAGRAPDTDLQLAHPSVSSSHCEFTISGSEVSIKDLGSTNGIVIDGNAVQESRILPGQIVRLGEVEVLRPEPQSAPRLRVAAAAPSAPKPIAPASLAAYAPSLVSSRAKRPGSFYKSIPGAFLYPFKRNGLVLLLSSTLIFGIIDAALNFRVLGHILVSGIVGFVVGACVSGYIFLYLQSVITSTAIGENEMPAWPGYENWWESALQPYLRLLGIGAACLGPMIVVPMFTGPNGAWLIMPLAILGLLYAPMAFLTVAMDDSLLGLNPMLVIPSILRVPLEYLVICVVLGLVVIGHGQLTKWLDSFDQYLVSQIVGMFLGLYFAVVQMRLLGLLYYTRKERLGWGA